MHAEKVQCRAAKLWDDGTLMSEEHFEVQMSLSMGVVSEMTYTVSNGTLNPSIPYPIHGGGANFLCEHYVLKLFDTELSSSLIQRAVC